MMFDVLVVTFIFLIGFTDSEIIGSTFSAELEHFPLIGKATYASSLWPGGSSEQPGLSEYAVDGNFENIWAIHPCFSSNDGPGGPNWLAVDLGESVKLAQVVLLNRKDGPFANRLDNFIVGVTDEHPSNEMNMRDGHHLCGRYSGPVQAGAFAVVTCDKDTPSRRYLIIRQPVDGVGYLTICEMEAWIDVSTATPPLEEKPQDCKDIFMNDKDSPTGVHPIYPDGKTPVHVFCDMGTPGGPWTVIQRRQDGSVDFSRSWNDYAYGFGTVVAEFWLGNEYLHLLTSLGKHKLRIEMRDFNEEKRFAEYSSFFVNSIYDFYRLNVSGYSGNAGDSLEYHDCQHFSTIDADHDSYGAGNCAQLYRGGWWFNSCHVSNLNGLYLRGPYYTPEYAGVNWNGWRGNMYSLKTTEMKISRID